MAKPTRRSVLRAGVVLAATAAPLGVAHQAMSVVAGLGSGLRRSTFTPHVGSTFTFVGEGGNHRGVLKKVADLSTGPKSESRFRLLFAVKGSAPAQGTYRLRHGRLEGMDLFIAPVGPKAGVYEAIVDEAIVDAR